MATNNITPFYGEWLCEHINLYEFKGEEALLLKNRLVKVDVYSKESEAELVECYSEFIRLFENDMVEAMFFPPVKGITSKHAKAYLVENEYGVLTPIEMLEEQGIHAQYDLKEKGDSVLVKLSPKVMEALSNYRNSSVMAQTEASTKNRKTPNAFRGAAGLVIACICLSKCQEVLNISLSGFEFAIGKVPCMVIALIAIITAINGLLELLSGIQKARFVKAVDWCEKAGKDSEYITNINIKVNAEIARCRDIIRRGLAEKTLSTIPSGNANIIDNEIKVTKSKVDIVLNYLKNAKKHIRRVGYKTLAVLVAAILFMEYGVAAISNIDFNFKLPNLFPEKLAEVAVVDASASSALAAKKTGIVYGVEYTLDYDWETCWQDGMKTDGTGEWLSYRFEAPVAIKEIAVVNGRLVSEEKYFENGRVCTATVMFFLDDECVHEQQIEFVDEFSVEQKFTVNVEEGITCNNVTIVVDSVYAGSKYHDLCIAEVKFLTSVK